MLSENIKTLRKKMGWSQEVLAEKLHVVRQTISKWEKGLSVPDADMLTRLAEVFEVPVSELLGAKVEPGQNLDGVAAQLAQINEQLVIRNRRGRRIARTVLGVFLGGLLTLVVVTVLGYALFGLRTDSQTERLDTETVVETEFAEEGE